MSNHLTNTTFLNTIDMTVDNDHHSIFVSPTEKATFLADDFISPLSHYGILAIEGPDSQKFLQGQATCNSAAVTTSQSTDGAFCNVKGRMFSSFRLACAAENHFLLRMRRELVDTTEAKLSKYIVFSKAKQHNATQEYLLFGLNGDQARHNIEQVFGAAPSQKNENVVKDGNIVISLDEDQQSFECWIQVGAIQELWPTLKGELALAGSKSWEQLTIAKGWGEVSEKTAELFIPQMLNYQITGAVSFTKGCYTGQEIVARMQYKGKLKRPMYRIKIPATGFTAGDELFNADNGQSIGNIVNVIEVTDNASEALAVISSKDVQKNTVIAGKQQATIEILPLPYAITNNDH